MIAGTKISCHSYYQPLKLRNTVSEITLDMAANMGLIAKKCFPNATRVIDRFIILLFKFCVQISFLQFHVQKLALEALQEIRTPLASH
jgi:hypothetical protein